VGLDDEMLGQWERGWHGSDKFICARCIGDDYLRDIVARVATDEHTCSFCGAPPAAAFDVFMEAFMVGVRNMFNQADNAGMPWEGGYVFETWQHHELPEAFDWVAAEGHDVEVLDEIRACLEEKTYAAYTLPGEMEPDEVFSTAWTRFRDQILHRTRFVFWARKDTAERDYGSLGSCCASTRGNRRADRALRPDHDPAHRDGNVPSTGHARREDSQSWGATQLDG
jgi:HEPN/RES N-terminal domain 1